jgi:hypothetical protein
MYVVDQPRYLKKYYYKKLIAFTDDPIGYKPELLKVYAVNDEFERS